MNFSVAFQFLSSVPAFPSEDGGGRHGESTGERWSGGHYLGLLLSVELMAGGGTALAHPHHGDESERPSRIYVQLYNYAEASERTLRQGEKGAGEIFRKSGLEISWTTCNLAMPNARRDVNCTPQVRPLHFDVRIVRGIAMVPGVTSDETMGMAFGHIASVSFRQVVEEAAAAGIEPLQLLGVVIAHELGHLLLGPGHPKTGIMQPRWSAEDYFRATQDQLVFTAQQAEVLRRQARARAQESAAVVAASAR